MDSVFPVGFPYHAKEDKELYNEIRESFGYDFSVPKRSDFGKYEKKEQENMHKQFLCDMQGLGDVFRLVTPDGKEIPLDFVCDEKPM